MHLSPCDVTLTGAGSLDPNSATVHTSAVIATMRDLLQPEATIDLVQAAFGAATEVLSSKLVSILTTVGVPPVEALRIRRTVLVVCWCARGVRAHGWRRGVGVVRLDEAAKMRTPA